MDAEVVGDTIRYTAEIAVEKLRGIPLEDVVLSAGGARHARTGELLALANPAANAGATTLAVAKSAAQRAARNPGGTTLVVAGVAGAVLAFTQRDRIKAQASAGWSRLRSKERSDGFSEDSSRSYNPWPESAETRSNNRERRPNREEGTE